MRAIFWDLCADLNRDLPRMRRQFCRLNYRGMRQRQSGAFSVFGANTPGPEFREISRERGRRSLTRHAQGSDHPLGSHTSSRRSGKADLGSRGCQPQGCASAGRRQRAGWRRTAGGFGGGRGNFRAFGRRTAGGSGRGRAKKPHTRGFPGVPGVCAGAGVPGKNGASRGFIRVRAGQKRAAPGQNGGVRAGKKAGTAGVGGKKSPFLPRTRRATGLCWGENWRRKLAGRVGLFGAFRESSGGFDGKSWGATKKPFHAHIGRNRFLPLFFVDGAPSLGRIIWWFGRVAIWGGKSDECVTPRGTPHGKRKKEATP